MLSFCSDSILRTCPKEKNELLVHILLEPGGLFCYQEEYL